MPRSADTRTDDLLEVLSGPVLEAAPRLLGAVLRHDGVAVRITEVEAYDGPNDPGSHAFRGPTRRTQVMFGPPGHLYTYFTYGMHHCANVVCGPDGVASAVLLRAGEIVDGVDVARSRRATAPTATSPAARLGSARPSLSTCPTTGSTSPPERSSWDTSSTTTGSRRARAWDSDRHPTTPGGSG
jgi:hypothetical protein